MADLEHRMIVDAWLERCASGPSAAVRIDAFEAALAALWARAGLTLGEVTLAAIVDRVLVNAAHEFPSFACLRLEPTGRVSCDGLRSNDLEQAALKAGMRFALVELLTVVENLTAGILTPALHAELSLAVPDQEGKS